MNFQGQWKLVITMVAVNFGFAAVNVLLKKIPDQGTNHLVIVAYTVHFSYFLGTHCLLCGKVTVI